MTILGCLICDEGYNGEIPCPQCNTAAWDAYHQEHKQVVTIREAEASVEQGTCSHERRSVRVLDGGTSYTGLLCTACRDVVELVLLMSAETVDASIRGSAVNE